MQGMKIQSRSALIIFAVTAVAAFTGTACKGKHDQPLLDEGTPVMRATIRMSDPAAASQLGTGFFGLTANSWRWTGKEFSAVLAVPPGGAKQGGEVSLTFNIPDVVANALGPLTLTASVDGTSLGSEKYPMSGDYTFRKDVPATLLTKDSVMVKFALDKALPPKAPETRELGVIATSVGIQPK
jgi:hypothetical protein